MKQLTQKLLCLLLALGLMTGVFAGCNKTESGDASSPPATSSDAAGETADDTETESEEPSGEDDVDWDEDDTKADESEDSDSSLPELGTETEDDAEAQDVSVDNTTYLNKNFRGINFIHQLFNYMPDALGRTYTDKMVKLELDTMKKMRVNMVRSFYGCSLSYDATTQSYDWDSDYMKAFYQNCKDMEKIGVEVGITPQWSLSALMTGKSVNWQSVNSEMASYLVVTTDGNGDPVVDLDATAKNFAKFMGDSALAFEAHGVNNVKNLFCFTEVNNLLRGYRNGATAVEDRDYDALYPIFDAMVSAVDQGLKDVGLRKHYRIVAPCDNWDTEDDSEEYSRLVKYTIEKMRDKVDVIGSHRGYDRSSIYANDTYYDKPMEKLTDPMEQAAAAGMEYWIDEYNVAVEVYNYDEKRVSEQAPFKGTAYGAMTNSLMNMGGINTAFIWTLYDQQWPGLTNKEGEFDNGIHMTGSLPTLMESTTPDPAWYALSLITRYLDQGKTYACEIGFSVYLSAIERKDGEITVIVTNYNYEDTAVNINFEKSLGGKNFYRHLYDANTIVPRPGNAMIPADAVAKDVTTVIRDNLPSMSVAVYTTEKP